MKKIDTMLKKGYYPTKGGYTARLDVDIIQDGQLAVIPDIGFVAYKVNGEFAYKDEHPSDNLDLIVDQWVPLQERRD